MASTPQGQQLFPQISDIPTSTPSLTAPLEVPRIGWHTEEQMPRRFKPRAEAQPAATPEVILLPPPPAAVCQEDTRMTSSTLGKRQASAPLDEVLSRETSVSAPRRKGQKITCQADWPSEWREQLALFRRLEGVPQRVLYESWDEDLRRHVRYASATAMRNVIKSWRIDAAGSTQDSCSSQQSQPPTQSQKERQAPVATAEETSHNFLEGARIGEAKNPGPGPRQGKQTTRAHQTTPPGNRAPGESSKVYSVWNGQCGGREAPTPPAQEQAKGNRPGLKPLTDHRGNRPGGSGLGNQNPAAMRNTRSSRPVSESGNQQQPSRAAGSGSQGSPRGPPDPEEWTTVQGRRLSALHRDFQDLARTLRDTAQTLQHEQQRSGAQWHPPPRWESYNPWFPLSPNGWPHHTIHPLGSLPQATIPSLQPWRERESSFFSPRCSTQKDVWPQRQKRWRACASSSSNSSSSSSSTPKPQPHNHPTESERQTQHPGEGGGDPKGPEVIRPRVLR